MIKLQMDKTSRCSSSHHYLSKSNCIGVISGSINVKNPMLRSGRSAVEFWKNIFDIFFRFSLKFEARNIHDSQQNTQQMRKEIQKKNN